MHHKTVHHGSLQKYGPAVNILSMYVPMVYHRCTISSTLELVYDDPNAIEVYFFDRITGRLIRIENLADQSHIKVQYNDKQQPTSFNHSNGDTMTITYTDSGLLNFADIIDQEGNVKQSR